MIRTLTICTIIAVASPALACDPPGQVSATCYPSLQAALASAQSQQLPLWLPASIYNLTQELVIDYASTASTGLEIISDGAVINGPPNGRALSIACSGGTPENPKGCFYFNLRGKLFVNGNTASSVVRIGNNDFSDAHNSMRIDQLIVNNGGSGTAVNVNYVLNSDIWVGAVSAGSLGLRLAQVQFSRISGAASATHGTALSLDTGYSFSNTFSGLDLEVAQTCLAISSPSAQRNTWVSPYLNCPTPLTATAGASNLLINSLPPSLSGTGVISIP